jgi:hypothetical protein
LLELRAEDLKPIIEARPELMEALSRYLAKMQQFLAGSSDLRSSRS